MILLWLILLPFIGGALAWALSRWGAAVARWVSLVFLALDLALILCLFPGLANRDALAGRWLVELSWPWIPAFGIRFHLGLDGLGLLLALLTAVMGMIAVAASWREAPRNSGFFHFNLMWALAGIMGVFLALDLFLFYFFWELMLVPMYFLFLWGRARRFHAAVKFFMFTQLGGLLMLLSILGLHWLHASATGEVTFDYEALLRTPLGPSAGFLLFLGFFVAFAVKLGVIPFHSWLPDAYTHAPTAGSIVLAGLMAKTGAYGLLRFAVPLFPQAAHAFAPVALALGATGVLYGALFAFAQTDIKRLIAWSSVSHMGFVLMGIFAWDRLSLQGTVVLMLSHGIVTGGLFLFAGALEERFGTRELRGMGGLWASAPRLGGALMTLVMALMGLPGLGNFVGEVLILLGVWQRSALVAAISMGGIVLSVIYALRIPQRVLHGPSEGRVAPDLSAVETAAAAALISMTVWIGLYPGPVLQASLPALEALSATAARAPSVPRPRSAPRTQVVPILLEPPPKPETPSGAGGEL